MGHEGPCTPILLLWLHSKHLKSSYCGSCDLLFTKNSLGVRQGTKSGEGDSFGPVLYYSVPKGGGGGLIWPLAVMDEHNSVLELARGPWFRVKNRNIVNLVPLLCALAVFSFRERLRPDKCCISITSHPCSSSPLLALHASWGETST